MEREANLSEQRRPAKLGQTRNRIHTGRDAWLVGLALAQGAVLLAVPSTLFIGLGLWWNANTISHNFIHQPFFRSRKLNALFSMYLSLLLGIPQTLWRNRHLAHHANA